MSSLHTGKLPARTLERLLESIRIEDEHVVLGPRIGEDAAVIRLGQKLLVAKTDPVTLATDLIGWYAVHVNANDIATMGVRPRWFMATIILPEKSTAAEAEKIFEQVLSACRSLEIALVGGHTEISRDLSRPIVVGCMLAEAEEGTIITTSGARPGDDIVLTRGIAIEGTAILARESGEALLAAGLSRDIIARAADYLFSPGISVLKEALTACSVGRIHSMHDPTEGGLATGLQEIATAARVGILVEEEKIPVLAECRAICNGLGLDPLGLLASGALIITLYPPETSALLSALGEAGINATVIGSVTAAEEGVMMRTATRTRELPHFERDELARFLDDRSRAS